MYVNFLSTYSDKKSCHTLITLQTNNAWFVSDSWASCKSTRCWGGQHVYVGFSRRKIPPTLKRYEKAIPFRHPDYNPDLVQTLISLSMSRHLSTRNISSNPCMRFPVILLTDRQTDKRTRAKTLPPPLSEVNKEIYIALVYVCAADLPSSHTYDRNSYFGSVWHSYTNTSVSCISACSHGKT